MKRMGASNILICGMKGLGIEIAKNIVLAGVKSVTIYDNEVCSAADMSSQVYCSKLNYGTKSNNGLFSSSVLHH